MSKQPADFAHLGDGELPPPYSREEPASSTPPDDSLFAAHLAAVRSQMRAQQAARASQQDRHDTQLLALLMPHVEAVLASVVGAEQQAPRLVQATLVPDGAVAADWTPAETDGGRPGETHSVVRVQTTRRPDKMAADSKTDGRARWGEHVAVGDDEAELLWWKDEDLAVRLAGYLQPAPRSTPAPAVDRRTVAAQVTEAKKTRSRWNILGSRSSSSSTPPIPPAASTPAAEGDDDVSMLVTAEEVTFRRENEMGIWESSTGWGVVEWEIPSQKRQKPQLKKSARRDCHGRRPPIIAFAQLMHRTYGGGGARRSQDKGSPARLGLRLSTPHLIESLRDRSMAKRGEESLGVYGGGGHAA
ncbi:hypothetical protein A9K55_006786 [Cordyceps militaris]|uniref:Uncharacterized protein n=1 Tax=Cordyceps militaris TaxID=73501 RepID=A0A2H4SCU4_CORMI|nr:hypothetical protein A9K55_006786 [Cordyceps militaris]